MAREEEEEGKSFETPEDTAYAKHTLPQTYNIAPENGWWED